MASLISAPRTELSGGGRGGSEQPAEARWRARIVLLTAAGCGTNGIARKAEAPRAPSGAGRSASRMGVSTDCSTTRRAHHPFLLWLPPPPSASSR
jgi:hypothetical protein